ncbi:hypothetical protein EAG_12606 [Camponotus floridanus]|uniref:Uncharacterized protein n=1 Tax=Camponotus floridanus TaxID=104421 RepID=E2AJD6_CAMFO|nr:hypothetical protein EAG_12606 [Camponotus floridanus]
MLVCRDHEPTYAAEFRGSCQPLGRSQTSADGIAVCRVSAILASFNDRILYENGGRDANTADLTVGKVLWLDHHRNKHRKVSHHAKMKYCFDCKFGFECRAERQCSEAKKGLGLILVDSASAGNENYPQQVAVEMHRAASRGFAT